ncbi:hypothetical protein B0H10DRAFT_2230796 [Mycena sp. CBHHK59/15]|nr:hypothetical protein B0H10DRAFT_2230796 [Mycena sp. CBHHK59/15]
MRVARAFSGCALRNRQPFFSPPPLSTNEVKKLAFTRRRAARNINPWAEKDYGAILNAFRRGPQDLPKSRRDYAIRVKAALSKLQDPRSFKVEDLTLGNFFNWDTPELALVDLFNPLGIPPDTPEIGVLPIHNPSVVATALSEAGFKGTFLQVDRFQSQAMLDVPVYAAHRPWPDYTPLRRGGHVYPPRLLFDPEPSLGAVMLTLPGATIRPLYEFITSFSNDHPNFKMVFNVISIWMRSHDIQLSPQARGLMVAASMQTEDAPVSSHVPPRGWANLEYRRGDGDWRQTVVPVAVDFKPAGDLPRSAYLIDLFNFFRHWQKAIGEKSLHNAFGVANNLTPRTYSPEKPRKGSYAFDKKNIDVPTLDLPAWRYDRLIIQDPFLETHNHAELLSDADVQQLLRQLVRTVEILAQGRPARETFGRQAAPPGSAEEAKILAHPYVYHTAMSLLQLDRVPADFAPSKTEVDLQNELEPPPTKPPRNPIVKPLYERSHRQFHTSSILLTKRWFPNDSAIEPPKPIVRPTRPGVRPLGLTRPDIYPYFPVGPSSAPVREPTFWRPSAHPLTLPAKEEFRPLPPVRPSKAGVAYKSILPTPRNFHASACLSRGLRPMSQAKVRAEEEDEAKAEKDAETNARTSEVVVDAGFVRIALCAPAYGEDRPSSMSLASGRSARYNDTRYGISSPSSDLDMVLLDPSRPYGFAPGYTTRLPLIYNIRKLATVLERGGFQVRETVAGAAVPIVKFEDRVTGHSCDINVNDRLGLLNSDLIKRYCELNLVLVHMMKYIKKWARPLGLNAPAARSGPVSFSSYALVLLTIGFLQHRRLLPNLQEGLPPLEPGTLEGTFWLHHPKPLCCDTRYYQGEGWIPPHTVPVHELIRDWFKFWAFEFDVEKEMISIRHGGRILRSTLPGEFQGTKNICNLDPFIRTKNCTQSVSHDTISRFKLDCHRYAMMPEFDLGELPRLPGYTRAHAKKRNTGDKLVLDFMNTKDWLPVKDDVLPWRETPRQEVNTDPAEKPTESLWSDPPFESGAVAEGIPDVPEVPADAESTNDHPLDHSALPPEWTRVLLDSPKPLAFPGTSSSAPKYDPTILVDDYGRPIRKTPPPRIVPSEPEEDQVGFGMKSEP